VTPASATPKCYGGQALLLQGFGGQALQKVGGQALQKVGGQALQKVGGQALQKVGGQAGKRPIRIGPPRLF
jgi:hypothetical protein